MISHLPLPSDHEAELERRVSATERLVDFAQFVDPTYVVDPMHRVIASALDKVISGEYQRLGLRGLIVNVPPQHGKSDLVSVKFPAFSFGKNPTWPIILTSYASELAEDKSFQIRELVRGDSYRKLFPNTRLHPDSQAKNMWKLDTPYEKTHLLTGGVNSGVTGFGGMIGIIDDPYKNWQEAQSVTTRATVSNFYKSVLRTRLWDGSFVILPMTRWHPDDISGELARTGNWAVLRIPAICESQALRDENNKLYGLPPGLPDPLGRQEGEACSPSRFPLPLLRGNEIDLGTVLFRALYQQDPRGVHESISISEDDILRRDTVPAEVKQRSIKCRYWDKAGTELGGKYTASVMMQYDPREDFWWIDSDEIEHFQYSARKREQRIQEVSDRDDKNYGYGEMMTVVEQEPGSGGLESAENTLTGLTGVNAQIDKVNTNKDVRLQPFIARIEARRVIVTRGSGGDKLVAELKTLPNSVYRDLSDCAGGAYAKIAQRLKAKPAHALIQSTSRAEIMNRHMQIDRRRRDVKFNR